ncbi:MULTISPECIES: ferredoxin reductase family protein [unclassified Streptomyces]|uniref:ferredoxin reductase family protein n=1 Tax=unclassified Streptomyces TaxID=2593676 RepID=UPI002E220698|nr:ferredoxin reductase family protein [Streptomyces sp. NBC_01023]
MTEQIPDISPPAFGLGRERNPGAPSKKERLNAALVRRLCAVAFCAGLLSFVCLWVRDGAIANLVTKPEGPLKYPGTLTGLVSAYLMFVQVVLMARIPCIERSVGRDRLVRIHRLSGFASLNLMLAHIVLLAFSYVVRDGRSLLGSLWWMVAEWRGMMLATLGTVLLVVVGITSSRAARKRLRYHSWHLLHLYTFLGIGLVVPHMVWAGSEFKQLWAQAYIVSLYVVTLGSLLVFRVGMPALRSVRHRIVVERVVEDAPGNVSVHLRGRGLDELRAQAGQFFIWRFRDGRGWTRGNPYALSAPPHGDVLRITAKEVGVNSRRLRMLRPGTRVLFEGPYGRFTGESRHGRKLTAMACGIGITPLCALLTDLDYAADEAVLLYRASSENDFVLRRELDELAQERGVRIVYLPGHRARGRASWQTEHAAEDDHIALRQLVPDISEHDIYICGPDAWGRSAADAARRAGAPAKHIHLERFAF